MQDAQHGCARLKQNEKQNKYIAIKSLQEKNIRSLLDTHGTVSREQGSKARNKRKKFWQHVQYDSNQTSQRPRVVTKNAHYYKKNFQTLLN